MLRTVRARDNQTQFGGYDDGCHGLLVTCESRARRWRLALADDGLCPGVPVPQEDGAVSASGRDIAVGGDIALAARQASDHSVVTEDNLDDFRCKSDVYLICRASSGDSYYLSF